MNFLNFIYIYKINFFTFIKYRYKNNKNYKKKSKKY